MRTRIFPRHLTLLGRILLLVAAATLGGFARPALASYPPSTVSYRAPYIEVFNVDSNNNYLCVSDSLGGVEGCTSGVESGGGWTMGPNGWFSISNCSAFPPIVASGDPCYQANWSLPNPPASGGHSSTVVGHACIYSGAWAGSLNANDPFRTQYAGWCLVAGTIAPPPPTCPAGTVQDPYSLQCYKFPERNGGCPNGCQQSGDPINTGAGNMYEAVVDFTGGGAFPLIFRRSYNSGIANAGGGASGADQSLGFGWTTDQTSHLSIYITPQQYTACIDPYTGTHYICPVHPADMPGTITVWRSDGSQQIFSGQFHPDGTPASTSFTPEQGSIGQLSFNGTNYVYLRADGYSELFESHGRLTAVQMPGGLQQTYGYDSNNRLTSVTDPAGRTMSFTYDANDRIQTMTNPAGGIFTYAYDTSGNLASVTYPDLNNPSGVTVQYLYEMPSTFPHALTGIIDENGNRYATWGYDSQGHANSSQNAGGVNSFGITYDTDANGNVTGSHVTEPTGLVRDLAFTMVNSVSMLTSASARCTTCADKSKTISYNFDPDGTLHKSVTDFNNVVYNYIIDPNGNETSRTEAVGTTIERTIDTHWDLSVNRPDLVTEAGRTTVYTYDGAGNVLTKTVTDTATSEARATTYTYYPSGLLHTATDALNHTTTYTYTAAGDLSTVTNALNQVVTTVNSYDSNGLPTSTTDANGAQTTMSYDARGRLLSRSIASATTQLLYDAAGNLVKVTQPNNAYLQYAYDDAHRLTSVTNNLGEYLLYTLDSEGNRVEEDTCASSANCGPTLSGDIRVHKRTYDTQNRLVQDIGGMSQTTIYSNYDGNGNVQTIADAASQVTQRSYDALNRLSAVLDVNLGTTTYLYDAFDRIEFVTDPRSLTTQYHYDAFGDVKQLDSPDTGTTQYTYDLVGNRLTKTDARNVQATYTYDALNRIAGISYPHTAQNVTYTYDQGTNGIGHMTSMTDPSGSTSWTYDARGNVLSKASTVSSVSATVSYAYNLADQLASISYPVAASLYPDTLSISRDATGRVHGLTNSSGQYWLGTPPCHITPCSNATIAGATYEPFGSFASLIFGNGGLGTGLTDSRTYDLDGRLTSLTLPGVQSQTFGYYLTNDISGITDNLNSSRTQTFSYDALGHLTAATGVYGSKTYTYDADGNRTTSGSATYSYPSTSNRLSSVNSTSYQYDAAGNTTNDGIHTYTYNDAGRLATVDANVQYVYNGLGQRVAKVVGSTTTRAFYDEAGHLLNDAGKLHFWLSDTPVGMAVVGGTLSNRTMTYYYVQSDQLGIPRAITNASGTTVWRLDSDPFGVGTPSPASITYNLRFPGQYYDAETGHSYNVARDYDSSLGRYLQSDPIGLGGGVNTYLYVRDNPIRYIDRYGLVTCGSSWYEGAIPDNPLGYPFSGCCADHDSCYGNCNGPKKFQCDNAFHQCMLAKCSQYQGVSNWACNSLADTYYDAVKNHGQTAFNAARKDCPKCNGKQ